MKKIIIKGVMLNADRMMSFEGVNSKDGKFFVKATYDTKSLSEAGYLQNDSRFIQFETEAERDAALQAI